MRRKEKKQPLDQIELIVLFDHAAGWNNGYIRPVVALAIDTCNMFLLMCQ